MVNKSNKPSEIEVDQLRKAIQKFSKKHSIPFDPYEKTWNSTITDFSKNARISYGQQKNFTFCLIEFRKLQFIGITKRLPTDEYDQVRAQFIAVYRATEDLVGYLAR